MRKGRFSEEQIINVPKKTRIWAIDGPEWLGRR
jgi:hypothetical protein